MFLPNPQDSSGADSSRVLENVVEQLVHFRSDVRSFALEPLADVSSGASGKKKQLHPDRLPLLKACDVLRKDLAPLGVDIKVSMSTLNAFSSEATASICFGWFLVKYIYMYVALDKTV